MRESRELYDMYYWDSMVKKQAKIADMNQDMSRQIEVEKAHIEPNQTEIQKARIERLEMQL
ncbi:hypothetical protein ABW21_db0200295 [Orbilia brochopaga]|nr:hypothetical protein ABW21_db0200295 [Drechslerella brochopaga]